MTLASNEIVTQRERGMINITPFFEARLQPASYDLTLGCNWALPVPEDIVEPYRESQPEDHWSRFKSSDYLLRPGEFMLATTTERVELSTQFCARVEGKSTLGRWGLLVHTTAGFVDPGFSGLITLELRNVGPFTLRLRAGMPICQVAFDRVEGATEAYKGRYQGQLEVGLPY